LKSEVIMLSSMTPARFHVSRWHWIVASLLLGGVVASTVRAEELSIFAAASLTDALSEIGVKFEKDEGIVCAFNFASSSTLARQIQEGAPADVFFSADEAKMDVLEKKHLLHSGSRRSLISNALVVIVHRDSRLTLDSPAELATARFTHLALAEPQSVPAGIYAKDYLVSHNLWPQVVDKIVPTENVRAALAAVESGNVAAGIVYKTDAAISRRVRVLYEVPLAEGPQISYPMAVVAGSQHLDAATRFLTHLASDPALDVFRKFGFIIRAAEP
jgi:molybdate transport system substrate-binding protein